MTQPPRQSWSQPSMRPEVQWKSFLDLPTEIKRQILQFVIPSGQTFRFTTRDPDAPKFEDPVFDFFGRLPRQILHPYQMLIQPEEEPRHGYPQTLLTFLQIHSSITPIVLEIACKGNWFSFPDVFTIQSFIEQTTGALCKFHITDMSIDACGLPILESGMKHRRFTFTKEEPDLRIAEVVKSFPNLECLILGGIGLGVPLSEKILGNHDEFERRTRFSSSIWSVKQITLIARIIGVGVNGESGRCSLTDGKVFHHINQQPINTQMNRGALQYYCTAILKKGRRSSMHSAELASRVQEHDTCEIEMLDIDEAMKKAEGHDENDGRCLRFENARNYLQKYQSL